MNEYRIYIFRFFLFALFLSAFTIALFFVTRDVRAKPTIVQQDAKIGYFDKNDQNVPLSSTKDVHMVVIYDYPMLHIQTFAVDVPFAPNGRLLIKEIPSMIHTLPSHTGIARVIHKTADGTEYDPVTGFLTNIGTYMHVDHGDPVQSDVQTTHLQQSSLSFAITCHDEGAGTGMICIKDQDKCCKTVFHSGGYPYAHAFSVCGCF